MNGAGYGRERTKVCPGAFDLLPLDADEATCARLHSWDGPEPGFKPRSAQEQSLSSLTRPMELWSHVDMWK